MGIVEFEGSIMTCGKASATQLKNFKETRGRSGWLYQRGWEKRANSTPAEHQWVSEFISGLLKITENTTKTVYFIKT